MADIKDIMGMSRGGPPAEKQEKQKEQKLVKPKGMSRWVIICWVFAVYLYHFQFPSLSIAYF